MDSTASPRPHTGGVTALGIVMIMFGALGLLSGPFTLLSRELASHTRSSRVQDIMWTGGYGHWLYAALGIGSLLAVLLLASGVGVLKRLPWARKTSLYYGIATIVFGVLGQLVNIMFLYPKLLAMLDTASAVERAGIMGGVVGGIAGGLFGMVLPIAIVIVVTRPSIKAELEGG